MNQKPQWRYREMQPGEINVDPIEGEFFTTEALGSLNDALVREAIQNSLDAALGNKPVTVRFSFHKQPNNGSDFKEVTNTYLNGIGPHLQARHSGLPSTPTNTEDFDYLLIEDYGTRGLQGDILQYDDLDDDQRRNDFYYFWRNIGRTRKGDTDLGRWGLGKTVFQAASRINSFFGLTVRDDDQRSMLMGQSVLKIHKVKGQRYAPYGFFGLFDNDLPLPIEDKSFIDAFIRQFNIERNERSGLSILIPYPERDINPIGSVKSAIIHYFFPILAGKLVFEIQHAGKAYAIDASSMDAVLKKSKIPEKDGLLCLVELARWAIRQPETSHIQLIEPTAGRVPKLRENLFEPEKLEMARNLFAESRRCSFHVPISYQRANSKEVTHTGFSVYLERDEKLNKAEDHFIRQGITIPEVSSLKHKGIRAIVSITDRSLSGFLGDAENPAHTDWERNSKKFKTKYRLGVSTLDFVKSSPREIVKILTQPRKGRDENLLKHLFALPAAPAEKTEDEIRKEKGAGKGKESDGTFVGVEGTKYLQLNSIKGGFSLMRKSKSTKVPKFINVWMAYEVRSGNPFKNYTSLDFDVSKKPIQILGDGVKLLLCKENTIFIEVQALNFKLVVIGFDTHRDLRIKTNP